MEASAKPAPNPAIVSQPIPDGEAILVHTDTAAFLVLKNPTTFLIWQLVDGQRTVQEIVAAVRQACPDAPPTADKEIVEMLDLLAAKGFIHLE